MIRYGSDKPDLRFDLPVQDVTEALKSCAFAVFSGAVAAGDTPGGGATFVATWPTPPPADGAADAS